MKSSNKSNLITGVVLLTLAALFTISLILQAFNFGPGSPSHNNILFLLGDMIFSVYGFSSILIPLFLFSSGISCFATKWTARKTVRLLTAIIPFFTIVITENICRSILNSGSKSFIGVKLSVAIVTGLMLVIIEYLAIGIIADKLNESIYKKQGKPAPDSQKIPHLLKKNHTETKKEEIKEEPEKPSVFDETLDELMKKNFSENSKNQSEEAEKSTENSEITNDEEKPPVTEDKISDTANSDEEKNPATIITQDEWAALTAPEAEVELEKADELEWNNVPPKPEKIPPEYTEEIFDENDPTFDFPPIDADENSVNPFIKTENKTEESEENSEEPENLDSEEAGNFDFAEPDSNFAENLSENSENQKSEEEDPFNFASYSLEPAALAEEDPFSAATYIDSFLDSDENSEENPEKEIENSEESEAETELSSEDFDEPVVLPDAEESETQKTTENPGNFAKTYQSPSYPTSITLNDDNDFLPKSENPSEEKKTEKKFPTRIRLDDELDSEIDAFEANNFEEIDDDGGKINFENSQNSAVNAVQTESEVEKSTGNSEHFVNPTARSVHSVAKKTSERKIDESFYDIDMNDDEAVSKAINSTQNIGLATDHLIAASNKNSLSSSISSVFSDMEKDIRENMPESQEKHPENFENVEYFEEVPESQEISDNIDSKNQNLNENSQILLNSDGTIANDENSEFSINPEKAEQYQKAGVTNLTKDELSDFFNAQQEENTPHGQEISGGIAHTNRAVKKGPYAIPSNLLTAYKDDEYWIIDEQTKQASLKLKQTLAEFNIEADIIGIKKGPVVTMFEILPAPGVKLSKIVALQDNIALSLAAQSVRIVAPIPGKQAVGIEVPNKHRSIVGFREIIEMNLDEWNKMAVPVILGKDILGKAQLIDLVKTPHMLIAGATGSGKSVCVNSLILSILYKRSFRDVKLILVDPKVVELKLYNNIPHLLTPVITEPKKALQALQYCLCEMERRYALLDSMGVRDISSYNKRIIERHIATEKLPYIVVIIDEFADLMATSGKELESIVARLTAMSRAVGIHLVLATQRPSVNVITGLIKANIPSRIAFMVSSRTDSNIIIDSVGAEKLLGRGDMLYASATDPAPVRIQGTFVSDQEVEDVVNAVKEYGEPDYIDDEIFFDDDDDTSGKDLFGNSMTDDDPLYDQALEIVLQAGKASASYLQRRLSIGYNRAARLVEEMEERGIVGPANGSKPREIIHVP